MKVKKVALLIAVLSLLVFAYQPAQAEVNVGVGVSVGLPLFNFPAPPQLVVIPGTYAYYVPGIDAEIIFYRGRWYRPWGGRWYWGRGYNGPWVLAGRGFVPAPLFRLPRDYRHGPVYHRIPYYDLHRHWNRWERERHWEHRYDWWRNGRDEYRRNHGGRDWDGRREAREDRRERKGDRREMKEDRRERKEDLREKREDRRERKEDLGEKREDRRERKEDRSDMKEDRKERKDDKDRK